MDADARRFTEAEGWLELGNWQEANDTVEAMAPRAKATFEVLLLGCRVFAAAGRWDAVEAVAATLVKQRPQEWRPFFLLAQCDAQRGDAMAAAEKLDHISRLPGTDSLLKAVSDLARDPYGSNAGKPKEPSPCCHWPDWHCLRRVP